MITHALGDTPRALGSRINGRTIRSLFRRHSPGIWYDPQDLTTLYQDAAGTLPVYRPGTGLVDPPVGLMLDKSQGLELGPELITNGDFSDGAEGWTADDSTLSVESGKLRVTTILDYGRAFQQIAVIAGKTYKVEGSISIVSGFPATSVQFSSDLASGGGVRVGDSDAGYTTRTVRFYWKAPATQSYALVLMNSTPHAAVNDFDGISVREIKGYHAYQSTTTDRPTLSGRYNLLTATETLSTQSVTTAATNYTLRFEGPGTITLSGTATGTYSAGTHTITCTAGTLTCTVAGTVTKADLRVKRDGSSLPAYQSVTNANTYDTAGFPLFLKRDKVDDDLIVLAPAITGAWAHGTIDGPVIGTVAIPAGEYHPFGIEPTFGLPDCTQWIAIDGTLSASEQAVFERYVYSKARQLIDVKQFGSVRVFANWLRERADITGIDLSRTDLSNATNLYDFLRGSVNITEIDLSGTNLKIAPAYLAPYASKLETVNITGLTFSGSSWSQAFVYCSNLTTIKLDPSIPIPQTSFTNTFFGTNLNQASIDGILVCINTAGTSNGTFTQSGGSAPSATGQAAITAMRSRGWTIAVTGGF